MQKVPKILKAPKHRNTKLIKFTTNTINMSINPISCLFSRKKMVAVMIAAGIFSVSAHGGGEHSN